MITAIMLESLTKDEAIVLDLTIKLKQNFEISKELGIPAYMIKYILNSIYYKLQTMPRTKHKLRLDWSMSVHLL